MNNITEFLNDFALLILGAGALVVALLKTYKNTRKELDSIPKKLKRQASIDNLIIEELEKLKESVNADRVQIYDFHNGGHYANGRSALKTSCTYEVCRSSVQAKQSQLQAVPISCIPKFVSTLLEDGKFEVSDLDKIKDSMPSTYQLKKSMKVTSFYDVILNDKNGNPIGFLAIQYVKNPYNIKYESDREKVLKTKFFIEEKLETLLKGRK